MNPLSAIDFIDDKSLYGATADAGRSRQLENSRRSLGYPRSHKQPSDVIAVIRKACF